MTDTASSARLERAVEKLTEAIGKQGETLHAIQLEQALQKAGIDAIRKSSEYTSGLLTNLRTEYDATKDKVTQLDSVVLGEGGLKEVVKKLDEKATAGRTIYRTAAWIVGAIITLSVLIGAISIIVQATVASAPSPIGKETNTMVRELKDRIDSPNMSVPR